MTQRNKAAATHRAKWIIALMVLAVLFLSSEQMAKAQVALAPSLHQQFVDTSGNLLSGGFLYSYQAGTSTPQATYADSLGTIANSNPIPLDATGSPSNSSGAQVQVWLLNASYKFCAYNSALVLQWCWDNVSSFQILNNLSSLTLAGVTSDPSGVAGMLTYRSDIPCFRSYTTQWDCFVRLNDIQTLTNKTLTSPTINGGTLTNPAINGVTPSAVAPTPGQIFTATSPTAAGFASRTIGIPFVIDGGGIPLTTGTKGYIEIPFACTIIGWTALGDQVGSVVVDVKRSTYAGFPTTASIAGSDKPTLAGVQKNQNLSLSAWTTAINAGDILEFNVNSITTITRVTISLRATIP